MKAPAKALCFLCALCVLCGAAFSLDREAFSIRNYDLNLQIEPEQHRLGVRGKITLRNDTNTPQKIAVLQISSSLGWRSIKAGDRAVQFVTQPYTSDIDHTGELSEAIVTLPQEVAPRASVSLDIAYEGVILADATRLTRIGTPEDIAKSSDWDQIDTNFTGVRGAGYVAWYPIATEVANLSEGDSLFEVLGRWKVREVGANVQLKISAVSNAPDTSNVILPSCFRYQGAAAVVYCEPVMQELSPPTFAIGDYQLLDRQSLAIMYLAGHEAFATVYADEAEKVSPFIAEWFGKPQRAEIVELAPPSAVPFESGPLFLTPLTVSQPKLIRLALIHRLTHAAFASFRPWIGEGLAHFAQVLYLEHEDGRQSALDYMASHTLAFAEAEKFQSSAGTDLISTANEELYRSKAMCVWWMLRDMIGDAALKKALGAYRPEEDNDSSYMPRLISAHTERDLSWFFDDWVYHDRGLPDFKVESAFSSKTLTKSFMVAVTVDNLGAAGAEVPVKVKFAGGEVIKRLEVRARQKATIRIETPAAAQEIVVNDGSVPESDTSNNTLKVTPPTE